MGFICCEKGLHHDVNIFKFFHIKLFHVPNVHALQITNCNMLIQALKFIAYFTLVKT